MYKRISLLEKFLTGDGAEPIENSFTMSILAGENNLTVLAQGSLGNTIQIHRDTGTIRTAYFSEGLHFSLTRVNLKT